MGNKIVRRGTDIRANRLFRDKVARSADLNACWPWTGAITAQHGYGNLRWQGRYVSAHRVAWMVQNGAIPAGMCVLHKCDNRPCCNPRHLFLGTKLDNNRDKTNKGRQSRGEKAHHAKLKEQDARMIRALYKKFSPRKSNSKELSARFGVSRGTVNQIARGDRWTHLA